MSTVLEATFGPRLTGSRSGPFSGFIGVPGDKSMSHRALIFGGLANGLTRIRGLLEGDDVLRTADAVRALGAQVERADSGEWTVRGAEWQAPAEPIDCANSGTGARLLMGAVAGFPIDVTFTGDASLSGRPMERVLGPLRSMGARTEGSTLPVTIRGGRLHGMHFVNEKASAQVKSAILLAGLRAEGDVVVIEPRLSRDHTENMLRAFGCDVTSEDGVISLGERRSLTATDVAIPGDPSSAAFPIVASLIVPGSQVTVRNVMVNPLRAGLFTTLQEMGADLRFVDERREGGEPVADIVATASALRGVEVPASRAPSMIDEYPILAVAAAFAQGRTVMRGLSELRVKESDRLAAVIAGLQACGVDAWDEGDDLIVEGLGGPPRGGADVQAHHDHRIAMSFLVMGLAAQKAVTVDSADMIATSFPDFTPLMRSIGGSIQ
ncbi:3-phosphoshikimate 1-carboxyvinyltransferase [Sphingomonas sp. SM33]|uniref:3-phosphoshikimate 1-carboxyvinyltransferase n=1 Tax=Sphingomonas telluris TaxID=2907998 RepID=A0ABS9VNJ6_9SPHN|nr:3-phosphoshikimate 1-carboxyvinyltransferase [Sphingomonas telluris]MCH8616069.1 3-phosphoshikimate 1-carboxyvinyltransferase [Sphingomonas telluris]